MQYGLYCILEEQSAKIVVHLVEFERGNMMKYLKRKKNFSVGLLTLFLASTMSFNANALVSEKCKSGVILAHKVLKMKSVSNLQIETLIEFARTQCSANVVVQGKGAGDDY
jgi:hypothetical protein